MRGTLIAAILVVAAIAGGYSASSTPRRQNRSYESRDRKTTRHQEGVGHQVDRLGIDRRLAGESKRLDVLLAS